VLASDGSPFAKDSRPLSRDPRPHHETPAAMAGDSDLSKAADKGKGKAVDGERNAEENKKDKDGVPAVNGKKEETDDC
jgi:hypothetical protein